ncbi:MAG: hypothetical protein GTO62_18915, partial [Planctomycetales bacterium]|nr:hypothetical protein [Planctomycetales bacterium]NIP71273.1 hypothetical protein [Planctomycetales bacterium]
MAWLPTTQEIHDTFRSQIVSLGGKVTGVFHQGEHLFLRSLLPPQQEVGRRDLVQGGVALRTHGQDVVVHPYVFRQVCRNGAIMAQITGTRQISRTDEEVTPYDSGQIVEEVRHQIVECARPEVLYASASNMRAAQEIIVDLALTILPWLQRMPP